MRRFLQILFVLLLIAAGIGGRYLYNRGLTKSWREWVVAEVRKHGVELSFGRLTVRPFRGLVAKDVKVYDGPQRRRIIAQVNEMVVEANYANALKGRPFLDGLTLVDTRLRLPLDPANPFGASINVDRMNARILFPPNQIHMTRFEATVLGVRIRASGSLTIPPQPQLPEEKRLIDLARLEPILSELSRLRFDGAAPLLNVHFGGDIAKPEEILVDADFAGERIRRGNYALNSLDIAATWQNNTLVVSRIEASDAKGHLQASGSFEPATRAVDMRVRSSLDLPRALESTNIPLDPNLVLNSPPQMDLSARIQLPESVGAAPKFHILGHVRLGDFEFGKITFDNMYGDISWDGRRWAVRDFVVRQSNGAELTGDAQQDFDENGKGEFRIGLKSNINLAAFAPLLSPESAAKLAAIKFHEPPRLTISARGSSPGIDTLSASGEIRLGRTTYRGSEARGLRTALRYNNRILSFDSFELTRAEGSASGSVIVDLRKTLVYFNGVKSTVNPAEAAIWIGPELLQDVKPYRFTRKMPLVHINGVLDPIKGGTRTRLNVDLDASAGFDYTFCKKELSFGATVGKLFFTDELLKLRDTRAELFGGKVTGEADVSLVKSKPGYTGSVKMDGTDFAKLSKIYFDYDDSKGKLDGTCKFSGVKDDTRLFRGEGELAVTEGNVFAIPFLGPLSHILSKIVPGMGYSRARKATASFSMADGIVSTNDFVVEGRGFSMIGDGRIWMVEDKMDFDVRINAQGLPGVVLFPVSKLLEYRANSRFSQPEWRPKVVPRLGGERTQ